MDFVFNNMSYDSQQEVTFAKIMNALEIDVKVYPEGINKLPDFFVPLSNNLFNELGGIYTEIKSTNRNYIKDRSEEIGHINFALKNGYLFVIEVPPLSKLKYKGQLVNFLKKPQTVYFDNNGSIGKQNKPYFKFISQNHGVEINIHTIDKIFTAIHF